MLTSVGGAASANTTNDLIFNTKGSAGSANFTQELAEALQGYLGNLGNGSQIEIDVQGGNNQFTLTVKNPSTASPQPAPPPAASSSVVAESQTSSAPVASASTIDKSQMTPDDAYWAEQPAAVQALRYMSNDQRPAAAQQLASEGYTIDVPIMVEGMDPLSTMMQRQADGYTWVPAALQPSLSEGPGIDFPGATPYDPDHPPAGSIKVTTDFAMGTNMQDAWVSPQQITSTFSTPNSGSTTT